MKEITDFLKTEEERLLKQLIDNRKLFEDSICQKIDELLSQHELVFLTASNDKGVMYGHSEGISGEVGLLTTANEGANTFLVTLTKRRYRDFPLSLDQSLAIHLKNVDLAEVYNDSLRGGFQRDCTSLRGGDIVFKTYERNSCGDPEKTANVSVKNESMKFSRNFDYQSATNIINRFRRCLDESITKHKGIRESLGVRACKSEYNIWRDKSPTLTYIDT
jgi:hypothetical protein